MSTKVKQTTDKIEVGFDVSNVKEESSNIKCTEQSLETTVLEAEDIDYSLVTSIDPTGVSIGDAIEKELKFEDFAEGIRGIEPIKKEDLEETLISTIEKLQQDFDNEAIGSYKTRIEVAREIRKQVELLAAIRSL